MDINSVTTIISTMGFPIACCCAMFWFINKTMKELQKAITDNTEATNRLAATVDAYHREGK